MSWRVVPLEVHNACMNMAIDEAVSEAVSDGVSPATMRFYRWRPSAVSIGYFQSLKDEVDLEACSRDGVDYVRRRTGGGAVYHDYDGEVTYSLIGVLDEFPEDLLESYRYICGMVIEALDRLGIDAEFEPVNDISVGERKISGNAQTRRKGVLLQHGTVLYSVDAGKMFTYLSPDVEKVSDKMIEGAESRVTSVSAEVDVDIMDVYNALRESFVDELGGEEMGFSDEELERARVLCDERYSSDGWSYMR